MPRRIPLLLLVCFCATSLYAQRLADIEIHGFLTQGVLFSSNNNYLTMESSDGSARWTDGAVSAAYSFSDKFRAGTQLDMYQLGELGGAHLQVNWASADYRFNDHFGVRVGKVKTVIGLFNDGQDVDAVFLWSLLPQAVYQADNESFFLSHVGGEVYGEVPLLGRWGKVRYDGYAGQVNLDLHGGYIKTLADDGLMFRNAPGGKIYGGDVRWATYLTGLTVGYSAYVQAANGTGPEGGEHLAPFFANGAYGQYQKRKFYFAGEYRRTPANPVARIGAVVIPVPLDERGWYAMMSYRLLKNVLVGSYYSHYVNNALDTSQPANYSKDIVISGRYDFNAYFYGKIEGHFLHGTGLGYYADTNPSGVRTNSNILAVKIGFSF